MPLSSELCLENGNRLQISTKKKRRKHMPKGPKAGEESKAYTITARPIPEHERSPLPLPLLLRNPSPTSQNPITHHPFLHSSQLLRRPPLRLRGGVRPCHLRPRPGRPPPRAMPNTMPIAPPPPALGMLLPQRAQRIIPSNFPLSNGLEKIRGI